MDAGTWRVQLAPGDGLVVRAGRSVLLSLPKGEQQEAFLTGLRAAVETVVQAEPDSPGRRVARSVAGLVSGADDDAVPPLAVAAATDDGVALLLVGDVEVEVTATDGSVELLSGRDAATWVDKVVRGYASIQARLGASAEFDPRSDLGAGAVSGSGFRLVGSDAPASAPAPAPAAADALEPPTELVDVPPDEVAPPAEVRAPAAPPQASPGFESVSLTEPLPDEEREPLPVLDEPLADPAAEGVSVQGINCSRGHFNDPTSIYCATCGISMVHQTHNLVTGPRPPLGVIVLDDGTVFPLHDDYVLGREPENAAEVRDGRALPLALDDPEAMVSRVHARIVLQGWDVRVVDAGSSNGTFVSRPGETDWSRLPVEEPTTILPGTRITMGNRSLVFDSYRKH